MRAKRLIAVTAASLVLLGGLVAVGAAAPADAASDTAAAAGTDARADNTTATDTDTDTGPAAAGDAAADGPDDDRAAGGVGPDGGLPAQVPDHVRGIHETIESFLSGSIDDLGGSLSGMLADGGPADDSPADGGSPDAAEG